jgi:hypothetical protein
MRYTAVQKQALFHFNVVIATGGYGPVNSIYLPGTITFSHLAVKKWSFAWATREQWRQPSTPFPRHIVRQFQSLYTPSQRGPIATPYSTSVSVPLYAITARGQLPRHIVRPFQSPYTPSPRGLSRISSRNARVKWRWHWLHVSPACYHSR